MRYFLLALAIPFMMRVGYGQVITGHVKNYGPDATHAEAVLSATVDELGVLFFATEKGVLTFDGDLWHVITLPQQVGAKFAEYDSVRHRLWVGGFGTFGYVIRDPTTRYRYVSLSDSAYSKTPFKQVWQILVDTSEVTFQTNEGLFLVKGDSVTREPFTETYVYDVDGIRYYSKRNGPLTIRENNQLKTIWNTPETGKGHILYEVVKLNDTQHLLFTPYDGVFVHHLQTHVITPYKTPLYKVLKESTFYSLFRLTENVFAFGTWDHGILISDLEGNVIDRITTEQGLLSIGVSDFVVDSFGKLWTATDNGISVVDLKSAWPSLIVKKPKLKTIITSIQINNDPELYWPTLDTTLFFSRRPEHVRIRFSMPGSEQLTRNPHDMQLAGLDTVWSSADNNYKDYYQLPNKAYIFRAKSNIQNVASEASLNFVIDEPWYTFLVDWGTSILIGLVIIFLLIFGITYRLRSSQKRLTQLVAEKTGEIEGHKQELLNINKNLKDTNEELDTFLYRSSHDLVSPLKSIKGLLNLMKLSKDEPEIYIGLMEDRVSRLEKILLEINTYVKNTKSDGATSRFELYASVSEVWSSLEFMEDAEKISCAIDIEKGLELDCDRELWDMVVSNLLANSIKYHDKRKSNQYIRFFAKREKEVMRILVEDNGQGIKQEHLERLFEMFYRANENSNGTGLGLFLVKKNVNRLNGNIRIESVYSKGTRVEITLPA